MKKIISYKNIFKLTFPVAISQSSIILSGIIDLAFVSIYGINAIAAVSIANVIISTLYNFLQGLQTGATVMISKASELKEHDKTASVLNIGIAISLILGILIAAFSKSFSFLIYNNLYSKSIRVFGIDYLNIWLIAVPVTLIVNVLVGFLRGLSDTITPLIISVIICIFNAVFDYMFVCGGFGMQSMGAKGSAFATLLSEIIGCIVLIILIVLKPETKKLLRLKMPTQKHVKEYLKLTIEIGAYTGFMNLALAIFVYIMGTFGASELSVHQITFQVFLISYLLSGGCLVCASIIIPKLLADKEYNLVIKSINKICKVSFFIIAFMSIILFIGAPKVAGIFSPKNKEVLSKSISTLRIISISQLFTSIYMTLRGALTGCCDNKFIAIEGAVSGYIIFLPLAYFLSVKLNYKVFGGYIAFLVWCMTDCTAYAVRFYIQKRWEHA